jgi:uncharacterized SAM-binding protein YcdF (DUF218 family)
MRKVLLQVGAIAVSLLLLANSGRFLVLNQPRASDVILVLAGETERRPERGVELLRKGIARKLVLNVPAEAKIFQSSELDIAQRYVQTLPEAQSISICPIYGLSTKAEAMDASHCLSSLRPRNILLVTSDHHTRRALLTFRKEVPQYEYSVAAAFDAQQFGTKWWRHREWAKVWLDEWLRLVWWELIDHWR